MSSVQMVCARLISSHFQSVFDSLDATRKSVLKITWMNSHPPFFSVILSMAPGKKLGLSSYNDYIGKQPPPWENQIGIFILAGLCVEC